MFEVAYLLINAFSTYIVLYAYSLTLGKRKSEDAVYYASVFGYYLVTSLVYLLFNTPLLNILGNIILLFIITLNFDASIKKRIIVALSFFAFVVAIESIVVMVYNMLDLSPHSRTYEMSIIWGMVIAKILTFILCGTILRKLNLKNRVKMATKQMFSVTIVTMGVLVLSYVLITMNYENMVLELISIISLFCICIFLFSFISITSKEFYEKEQRKLLEIQSDSYLNELKVVNKTQNEIRFLKHNMTNHLNTIQVLIDKGNYAKALEYIQSISRTMNNAEKVSNTNILELDSIINFKISSASEHGIKVNASIQVKEDLRICPQDYISVIGNLFDNAIEAVKNKNIENKDKYINLTIGVMHSLCVIIIENPYCHTIIKSDGKFLSTKKHQKGHGYGLLYVKNIADKYNGTINISYENNFIIEISMINN